MAKLVPALMLAGVALLFAIPLVAQENQANGAAPAAGNGAASGLSLVEVEAGLAVMEADAGITDAVKTLLRPKYQQAIEALKQAADFATQAADYRAAITTAPALAAELRAGLKATPATGSAASHTPAGSAGDLQKAIDWISTSTARHRPGTQPGAKRPEGRPSAPKSGSALAAGHINYFFRSK